MPTSKFDHQQIDTLLHSRIRLAIVAVLATVDEIDFNTLKTEVNTTDGNLSVHLKKLEEANYLSIDRSIVSRKTLTVVKITKSGLAALEAYFTTVDQFLHAARQE
jgi:DNA-binding MarR family transcriptional regulator